MLCCPRMSARLSLAANKKRSSGGIYFLPHRNEAHLEKHLSQACRVIR